MMRKTPNRFALAHSYKKEQAIDLLSQLTLEQLSTIVNFINKEVLLNIINNALSKSELHELIFKSNISDDSLYEFLLKKNRKTPVVKPIENTST